MNIKYWQGFSKRKNSTKQPSGTGTDLTVVMKDNTSREHPTFILSGYDWSMNYIQAFGDYYYVEDIITNTNGTSEVVCSIDPMATAKAEIGALNAFVEYTTNGNVLLADTRIPKKTYDLRTASAQVALPWTLMPGGSYRLAITGKTGCWIYSMELADLVDFLTDINTWTDDLFNFYQPPAVQNDVIDQIKETGQWLGSMASQFIKQIVGSGRVSENIRSCVWVPWPNEGNPMRMYVGQFDTGMNKNIVLLEHDVQDVTVSIPWPAGVTDWRRVSCVDVYLCLPFVGVIQLTPYSFSQFSTLFIKCSRSTMSGAIAYEVKAGTGAPAITLGTYGADAGADYPIGIQSVDLGKSITSVIAATAGVATGGAAGAAAAMYGAGSFIDSFVPNGSTIGGLGGSAASGLDMTIRCITIYHPLTEDPGDSAAIHGIPLFEHRTISSLSGYVKCAGASVQSALNDTDKEIINGYLNSGFYYE